MSTTHTPGPLSDEFVQSVADGPHPSNIKALAREVLRARQAAPDMLEALREWKRLDAQKRIQTWPGDIHAVTAAVRAGRAAIVKAEGRSQ